jgi:hypothetical protein
MTEPCAGDAGVRPLPGRGAMRRGSHGPEALEEETQQGAEKAERRHWKEG